MCELPNYVCMSSEEFLNFRANGVVSMGSAIDVYRQPGVVGMYGRKPVFLHNNDAEKELLQGNKLTEYLQRRGYVRYEMSNEPPQGPKITIP